MTSRRKVGKGKKQKIEKVKDIDKDIPFDPPILKPHGKTARIQKGQTRSRNNPNIIYQTDGTEDTKSANGTQFHQDMQRWFYKCMQGVDLVYIMTQEDPTHLIKTIFDYLHDYWKFSRLKNPGIESSHIQNSGRSLEIQFDTYMAHWIPQPKIQKTQKESSRPVRSSSRNSKETKSQIIERKGTKDLSQKKKSKRAPLEETENSGDELV